MKRERRFFLEPLDSHTNEVFARELSPTLACERRTVHGKWKKVCECSIDERERFFDSREHSYLKFYIWTALGEDRLRRWYPKKEVSKDLRLVPVQ